MKIKMKLIDSLLVLAFFGNIVGLVLTFTQGAK